MRPSGPVGGLLVVLALTLAVGAGACGRRSAESKAAERAQDACIGALAPVADAKVPSAAVLDEARADAEAAADVDDRWRPLLARVRGAEGTRGTQEFAPAIAALADECGRVNEIIRRGGKGPDAA